MKTISVGEFKSKFSQILDWIRRGEEVVVAYGRKKEEVAVLVDIRKFRKPRRRKLGPLEGKGSFKIHDNFEMSANELLGE
jgi:antitoxin (DNA-binding transcriptional repressor) of toxin-antitoxin stability system